MDWFFYSGLYARECHFSGDVNGILFASDDFIDGVVFSLYNVVGDENVVSSFYVEEEGFIEFPSGRQGRCRVWMDTDRGVIVKMHIYGADKKLCLIAWFDDYEKAQGYEWPGQIECDFVSSKVRLKVKYKRFFLNSGVSESYFRLRCPGDTPIENIEDPPAWWSRGERKSE